MRIRIVAMCLLIAGCTKVGPTGPTGPAGVSGSGFEFRQFGGYVPRTGMVTVSLPYLNMDCPPVISVFLETSPGNWIPAPVLDTFEEGGQTLYYLEFFVLHNGSMDVYSASAVALNNPVHFIVTIMAPVGYFETGDCL